MVEFKLKEPIKGEDLAEKLTKAFTEFQKSATYKKKKGLFRRKEVDAPRYHVGIESKAVYVCGDSGPKKCIGEIAVSLSYSNNHNKHVAFRFAGSDSITSLSIKCLDGNSAEDIEEKDWRYKTYGYSNLMETCIKQIFEALYGDKEQKDKGTGKVVY